MAGRPHTWEVLPTSNTWLTRDDGRWRIGQGPTGCWFIEQHVDGPGMTWSRIYVAETRTGAEMWISGYDAGVQAFGRELITTIEEWIEND